MVWAAADDRGARNTKPAVREFARHRSPTAQTLQAMQDLSEALLEDVDGAELAFFTAFGRPPYWSATVETSIPDEDEDEDDDE